MNTSFVYRVCAKEYNQSQEKWTASSANNGVHDVYFVRDGLEKRAHRGVKHGVMKPFACIRGTPDTFIQFTEHDTPVYTLFHLSRYLGAGETVDVGSPMQGRIVSSKDGDWFSGFWKGHSNVSFRSGNWISPPASYTARNDTHDSPPADTNWVLSTDYPSHHRCNGIEYHHSGHKKDAFSPLKPIGINYRDCVEWERSHFEFAELVLYDRVLSLGEIETMETYFACEYGIADMLER